jgi:hypothetical protein
MERESANRLETNMNKKKAPKTAWKKGQSGNPTGRPKDGESWASIIKVVGDLYPADLIAFIGANNDLGRMLSELPQQVQMKYLVTARVFSSLMFEPSSGLWKELMERAEGKVETPIKHSGEVGLTWKEFIDDDDQGESGENPANVRPQIPENTGQK